jgi:hypothetical protein
MKAIFIIECLQTSYRNNKSLRVHVDAVGLGIRHRCPTAKARFVEKQLGETSARSMRTKAVSVRSMSKALSGARLVGSTSGSIRIGSDLYA